MKANKTVKQYGQELDQRKATLEEKAKNVQNDRKVLTSDCSDECPLGLSNLNSQMGGVSYFAEVGN